jgi:hypothetical protein
MFQDVLDAQRIVASLAFDLIGTSGGDAMKAKKDRQCKGAGVQRLRIILS